MTFFHPDQRGQICAGCCKFGAINTGLITRIHRDVTEALRSFESRIEVLKVTVDQRFIAEGHLDVAIDYRVRTTNQPGNSVFPFYFKEGT